MKQLIAVIGILVVGAVILVVAIKLKPESKKVRNTDQRLLVQTTTVSRARHDVRISAQGTVIAAQKVDLQAEVGGRVVWQSPDLVPGGRFIKGAALLRIDPRDYAVAVEQQRANVDRVALDLELERGRKLIAEREWEVLHRTRSKTETEPDADGKALALRGPHLRTAKVALDAANSGLRRAELGLERTTIRAPFNGFVQDESVDVGQLLSPAARLGTLVATDSFWVQVSVPLDALSSIRLPGAKDPGADARVFQNIGGERSERNGRVIRFYGDVDPIGRMARLLVEIDDPFATAAAAGALPLLLGSYVEVEIDGGSLDSVAEIPRQALREGERVWVYGAGDKLEIRPVTIAWRRAETLLVRDGLADGDRVITSRLATPIPGMLLRTEIDTPTTAEPEIAAGAVPPAVEATP